jgi:DNA-binding NarL/FixJ family response regulator
MPRGATRLELALDAALDHIGAPAFVVDAHGAIERANQAGLELLAAEKQDVARELRDAIGGSSAYRGIEVTALGRNQPPCGWLAVVRTTLSQRTTTVALSRAATRWRLTPRQREVLELVVKGDATTAIAAHLGVTPRAVELHLTALFERVGVGSRAALIARVLGG